MGAITGGNNMPSHNLRISPDGNFYESSREPKEGYVEHVSSVSKQVSYWKEYYRGLYGELSYVALKDVTFNNVSTKVFTLGFKDEGEMWFISIQLLKQNGGMNNYVKDFIRKCPNIDITKKIFINPNKRKKDEEYAPNTFFLAYWDEEQGRAGEIIPHYWKNGTNGLPDRKEYMGIGGKKVFDYRDQDNFLYDKLVDFINKFNSAKSQQSTVNNNQPAYTTQQATPPSTQQATPPPTYQAPPAQAQYTNPTTPPPYSQDEDLPF